MVDKTSGQVSTKLSQQLYRRAKQMIPGGVQLLSKRPEMYAPEKWPAYYHAARGCEITDLDGNTFLDMTQMGIGCCLLGYADPLVSKAVMHRLQQGSMCTLNSPDEVQLAEELLQLHPWAKCARFLRSGGEAMAAAVRIARATTNRSVVAFCGYHGWHDWYLAANRTSGGDCDALQSHLLSGLSTKGVPTQLSDTAMPFRYNQIEDLHAIVRREGKNLAAVVMEPTRSTNPQEGFLESVRELCDQTGAVLIVDEITAGWRLWLGGSHLKFGLQPDIAVFAKALGNGHPIAAVIGRAKIMQAAQESFISSTYWTEGVGPAAALATLRRFRENDVPAHLARIGKMIQTGLQELGQTHIVPIKVSGHYAMTNIAFEHVDSAALLTLFTVRMLEHKILCGGVFYPSFTHESKHVELYLNAANAVFPELAIAAKQGDAVKRLDGFVKHTGFSRLA